MFVCCVVAERVPVLLVAEVRPDLALIPQEGKHLKSDFCYYKLYY